MNTHTHINSYIRCVFTRQSMFPKINKAMKHAKMCVKWEERPKSKNNNMYSAHYVLQIVHKHTFRRKFIGIGRACVWIVVCTTLLAWNWISNRLANIAVARTHTLTKCQYKHRFAATAHLGWMCVRAATQSMRHTDWSMCMSVCEQSVHYSEYYCCILQNCLVSCIAYHEAWAEGMLNVFSLVYVMIAIVFVHVYVRVCLSGRCTVCALQVNERDKMNVNESVRP